MPRIASYQGYQENFKSVKWSCKWGVKVLKSVQWVFKGSLKGVLRMFRGSFKVVSRKIEGCSKRP